MCMGQLHWHPTRKLLPAQHVDPLLDKEVWLKQIAEWAKRRLKSNPCLLAIDVICKDQKEWGGVGKYTVLEIFFIAGTLRC